MLLNLKHGAIKAAAQHSAGRTGIFTCRRKQPSRHCVALQQAEGHLVGIGEGHSLTDEVHVDAMLKDPSPKDESSAPLPLADAPALCFAWPRNINIRLMTQPAAKPQSLGAEQGLEDVLVHANQSVH